MFCEINHRRFVLVQLEKGLEDPTRRRAAADTVAQYCSTSKHDFQEHVPSLLTVSARQQSKLLQSSQGCANAPNQPLELHSADVVVPVQIGLNLKVASHQDVEWLVRRWWG
jgi:hypothetical protein